MREMFEAIDSGRYDGLGLAVGAVLFLFVWFWHIRAARANRRRSMARARAFFDARQRVIEAFEDPAMGPHTMEYCARVMHALNCWVVWQGRPLTTLTDVGCDPTEEEWHAMSLLQSLPSTGLAEHVM
jgi:hypothetical protein